MVSIQICFLLLVELLLHVMKANAKVSALIVFGDSTVDAGNNNYIHSLARADFPPYGRDFPDGKATGRFCNGRLSTDFMSEAFGLKPTVPAYLDPAYDIKDFATGVCFASSGAGFDIATTHVLNSLPLGKEVDYFKDYQKRLTVAMGQNKAQQILTDALYVISLGTNDWLANYFVVPHRRKEYSIPKYHDYLIGLVKDFLTELYNLGGRKMAMYGLAPIGCVPLERARKKGKCWPLYNNIAKEMNTKLQGLFSQLNKQLPGLQLVLTDTYDGLWEMIQNPQKHGFDNAQFACCGTGTVEESFFCNKFNPFTCSDADKHVFWDGFHPSQRTNQILTMLTMNTSLSVFR